MNKEDEDFEALLKRRLEEDIPPLDPRVVAEIARAAAAEAPAPRPRRSFSSFFWKIPLAAASIAAVTFAGWRCLESRAEPERTVARIIGLLYAADGDSSGEEESAGVDEMLLAWQDAPYRNVVAELGCDCESGMFMLEY